MRLTSEEETARPFTICCFWPEEPSARFYIQADNQGHAEAWAEWLRFSATASPEAVSQLTPKEINDRYVACGLPGDPALFPRADIEKSLHDCFGKRPNDLDELLPLSREANHSSSAVLTKIRGKVSLNKVGRNRRNRRNRSWTRSCNRSDNRCTSCTASASGSYSCTASWFYTIFPPSIHALHSGGTSCTASIWT